MSKMQELPGKVGTLARHAWRRLVRRRGRVLAGVILIAHVLGALSSVNALMSTRTSQGAIAWIVSLNTFPVVAVPAYWIFGQNKFHGYVLARRDVEHSFDDVMATVRQAAEPYVVRLPDDGRGALAGQSLAKMPYLRGNAVEQLVDGEATFASLLEGMARAREYILFQFYIVRDDEIGRRVADCLIERARAGVEVWFLYDEIGSLDLSGTYLRRLEDAGVRVSAFQSTRGVERFQLNFRNHRKIVVVDGKVGWTGGFNVGNEYLGQDPEFPNWRDTHVRIEGPAVLEMQLAFAEDWWWAREEALDLDWTPVAAPAGNATVLILPTGPADALESASLMYQQAIHSAQERIWIASPYFVPDHGVLSALQLAALRGVDVRVVIPDVPDSTLVFYAAWAFVGDLIRSGIKVYRYLPGFSHQKVFLVDDRMAGISTANLDNRSFRLNFEVTALIHDGGFVTEVERTFEKDFARSRQMRADEFEAKGFWFRLAARASYLTAPIL